MAEHARSAGFLNQADARIIRAGDLEAVFLPAHGMLGASLKHQGVELLGRADDLEAAAAKGSTAGIPLLHPWANRLAGPRYRVLGCEVVLDPSSPLLHFDEHGLPMHGVPWSLLQWTVTEAGADFVSARLDWSRDDLLALFPFRHQLEMTATMRPASLTLETVMAAGAEGAVPLSFGFHPYFTFREPRSGWHLELPAMRQLVLDARGIPAGGDHPFGGFNAQLGERSFDDGFALLEERAAFSVAEGSRKITVELLESYRYAQIFAPADKNFIALEPMTAPASALSSGSSLRLVAAGERLRVAFAIRVDTR